MEAERVEARVDAERMGPAIAGALAKLSKGERDVLLLYAWGELSLAQIAEALDLPNGTARSRLSRARRRLRERIGLSGQ